MSAVAVPASPHLDMRNVLWLIAAMAFVIAPHLARLPYWVALFCIAVLGWRTWISWAAIHFPPRWLVAVITLAATIGTFLQYGRLMGRDPGVTLLIVMAVLKLLEMRTQREVTLSIYLGFFLVMTNFLYSQAIPLGVYMLACVWIFVATMIGFNHVGRSPTVVQRLRPAAALVVQALPLMFAFFVLFPRTQGPLWALPQDARTAASGLSDSMSPGNIVNLIKSDTVAFRVQFADDPPPYQTLYWRGPVLVHFDGRTWTMGEEPMYTRRPDYPRRERPVSYTVQLEPHNKNWIFALDVPATLPPETVLRGDLQMRSMRLITDRHRYEMTSYIDYRYGENAGRGLLARALAYPRSHNPRTVALGQQWAAETSNPRAILLKALRLYNKDFTYTLEPPALDTENPYDDFLFNSKQGFCEHFSGSFALLMRAAGVPARVVTGYQGGEVNPITKELIVRQADAHAWVEVWLPGEGWSRIDPTSAVSPLRVEGGVNAALGPIGAIPALISADKLGVLENLRLMWLAMNGRWDTWVVGYNVERQRQFFSNLGFGDVDWRTLGFWLLIATFAVGGAVTLGLLVRDRPPRTDASLVAWNRFCTKLATTGLARASHEGPLDFLARVRAARPDLASEAEGITRGCIEARYGPGVSKEELRALARRTRAFDPARPG
jgi:transglutaminase-like putative cysteine protease